MARKGSTRRSRRTRRSSSWSNSSGSDKRSGVNPLMRRLLPLFLLVALVLPIACGGDSSDSTAAGETARAGADFEAEVGSTIEVPQGPAPKKLVIEDLKKG